MFHPLCYYNSMNRVVFLLNEKTPQEAVCACREAALHLEQAGIPARVSLALSSDNTKQEPPDPDTLLVCDNPEKVHSLLQKKPSRGCTAA